MLPARSKLSESQAVPAYSLLLIGPDPGVGDGQTTAILSYPGGQPKLRPPHSRVWAGVRSQPSEELVHRVLGRDVLLSLSA